MNILEQEDFVKGLPDEVLIEEAQAPTGNIPQYLVVSEIQRREKMRSKFDEQVPQETVTDQIISGGIAAMNPNPDPLMSMAMGAPDPMMGQDPMMQPPMQDPMMGQMQDPMMGQMPQDLAMGQQMPQDPMMQMPMQDPMMQPPMQDPMMQQGMMAAGGGMMPYRMQAGRATPSLHGAAKEQALRGLMAEGYSREDAEKMLAAMGAESLATEMGAFRNQISEGVAPWSPAMNAAFLAEGDLGRFRSGVDARMTGEVSPSSYGDIYPREQLEPVVDTAVGTANVGDGYTVGTIDGRPIIGEVESKYPLLQRNLGPELGTAAARMFPSLHPSLRAADRFVTDATADLGPNISDIGGELYDLGSSAAGGASDLASSAAGGVYSTLEDMGLVNNQYIRAAIEPSLQAGAGFFGAGAEKVGDFFRSLPDPSAAAIASYAGGLFGPKGEPVVAEKKKEVADPAIASNSLREDIFRAKKVDPETVEMIVAGPAGGEGKVTEPVEKRQNALTTAVTNVGTGAETDEDTEGLLKSLFGRSYKPMDDGALALINLGAGIAKGDLAGGMLGAATAMGEERDRRRKEDLSSAQAEFYRSGGSGRNKDTAWDMIAKARTRLKDMKYPEKVALLTKMLNRKPTNDEIGRAMDILLIPLAQQIARLDQIPAGSLATLQEPQVSGGRLVDPVREKQRIIDMDANMRSQLGT